MSVNVSDTLTFGGDAQAGSGVVAVNASGGEEKHTLTVRDAAEGVTTGEAGVGRPHNNLPPYVAVYYCTYGGGD